MSEEHFEYNQYGMIYQEKAIGYSTCYKDRTYFYDNDNQIDSIFEHNSIDEYPPFIHDEFIKYIYNNYGKLTHCYTRYYFSINDEERKGDFE